MEELPVKIGYFIRTFDNGGDEKPVSVIKVRTADGDHEAIGPTDETITRGMDCRLFGYWHEHARYGRQFRFESCVPEEPKDRAGMVAYLKQCRGIGVMVAGKIIDEFGNEAIEVLRNMPELVSQHVARLTLDQCVAASVLLNAAKATEQVRIELLSLLAGSGVRAKVHDELIHKFGTAAARIVRRNPFILLQFKSVGFGRADAIYLKQGGKPDAMKRQVLCLLDAMRTSPIGHTWFKEDFAKVRLSTKIGGTDIKPHRALKVALRAKGIRERKDILGASWYAETRMAMAEERIAERIRDISSQGQWPDISEIEGISDHQRATLIKACKSSFSVLLGSPGTGKTYTAARMIRHIQQHGSGTVMACAPTGKAAVRLGELLADCGVNGQDPASIHRTLQPIDPGYGDDNWVFNYDAENQLPCSYLFVDETSMVDTSLMRHLLVAVPDHCCVMLIGDTGQLPPVGKGAPLRDIVNAGVACGELTEIRRNEGEIVQACAEIRKGKFSAPRHGNLSLIPASGQRRQVNALLGLLKTIDRRGKLSRAGSVQVICATNDNSLISRKQLNEQLGPVLNERSDSALDVYAIGDKVISLKNQFCKVTDSKRKEFVANGDMGTVWQVASDGKSVDVRLFGSDETISVKVKGADASGQSPSVKWSKAWAITCHKFQGSEAPIIIVMLDDSYGAQQVTSREWLYTAISRAKDHCYLIGRIETAQKMAVRQTINQRVTFQREEIIDALKR